MYRAGTYRVSYQSCTFAIQWHCSDGRNESQGNEAMRGLRAGSIMGSHAAFRLRPFGATTMDVGAAGTEVVAIRHNPCL